MKGVGEEEGGMKGVGEEEEGMDDGVGEEEGGMRGLERSRGWGVWREKRREFERREG